MAQNRDDGGVNVTARTSNHKADTYQQSDIEVLYQRAKPHGWQELLTFVEKQGDSTWHITPGEAVAIKDAVQQAMREKVPFPEDSGKAYQYLSKFGTGGQASA